MSRKVCRAKAAFFRVAHPAIAPAGINRIGHGEVAEASAWKRSDGMAIETLPHLYSTGIRRSRILFGFAICWSGGNNSGFVAGKVQKPALNYLQDKNCTKGGRGSAAKVCLR